MEKDWLEARLAEGRSIESIAKEVGKHPSTVGYWVQKHGLRSQHAPKHAARGGVDREALVALIERGLSMRADRVRGRVELRGDPVLAEEVRAADRAAALLATGCREDTFDPPRVPDARLDRLRPHGARGYYRCPACTTERVASAAAGVKEILVAEAGGRCVVCGYDAYAGALQFHHLDPSQKRFGLALGGLTRALAEVREEARKCVLLCGNCHAEVEAGLVGSALPADTPG